VACARVTRIHALAPTSRGPPLPSVPRVPPPPLSLPDLPLSVPHFPLFAHYRQRAHGRPPRCGPTGVPAARRPPPPPAGMVLWNALIKPLLYLWQVVLSVTVAGATADKLLFVRWAWGGGAGGGVGVGPR